MSVKDLNGKLGKVGSGITIYPFYPIPFYPLIRCLPLSLAGPVIGARSQEPDPISNSAVKLLSADGTVSQDPGE